MSVEVKVSPNPKVGQTVEFRIVATDDSEIERECAGVTYGDDHDPYCVRSTPSCPAAPSPYGAWSPPEKRIDRYETVFSHTYDKPGTYTASFNLRSKAGCESPPNPYRSEGTETVTFTVEPS